MFTRAEKPEELETVVAELMQTNVVGNIYLFNLFLPLVLKGKVKVIAMTTCLADVDVTNEVEVDISGLYAASKAALISLCPSSTCNTRRTVFFSSVSARDWSRWTNKTTVRTLMILVGALMITIMNSLRNHN